MQRIKCNKPTYFDIDDTLILWAPTQEQLDKEGFDFKHCYDDGSCVSGRLVPHKVHLRQLHRHALRGHTIILWSAGGEPWCYAVACALGLDKYGNLYTIEKPTWAYDDKRPEQFFQTKYHPDTEDSPI